MATHGAISKFNPGRDDWSTWIEQLKFYFAANKVTDNDTERFILLANVAPPLSRVCWEHTLPVPISRKSLTSCKSAMSRILPRLFSGSSSTWVSTFGGMEWWNGMVEWNSGMDYWNGGILHSYLIIQHVLYSEQ